MPDMIEPFGVLDVYVSGMAEIEDIGGGCSRLTWYVKQAIFGSVEKVIVARLIVPNAIVPNIIAAMTANGADLN